MVKKRKEIIAVIQARMGSTRLPGKSLKVIAYGFPLLQMVILRTLQAKKVDSVILATSEKEDCDKIEKLALENDIEVIRGDEEDVLSRFAYVIEKFKPSAIVRICADNPFISPEAIDDLILFYQNNNLDYASNNTYKSGLADGFGCEIVKSEVISEIDKTITIRNYREHVTNFIAENPEKFKIGIVPLKAEHNYWNYKLDIDTLEDFQKIRNLCLKLSSGIAPYWSMEEIIKACSKIKDV